MRLFELQNTIDDQLEKTAQGIGRPQPGTQNGLGPATAGQPPMGGTTFGAAPDGGLGDPMGAGGMPGMSGDPQNMPDLPDGAGATDQELDTDRLAKIDARVQMAVIGHPYLTDYEHKERAPSSPLRIMTMPMEDLMAIRNKAKAEIMKRTMSSEVGQFARPDAKFYQDLLSFTEKLIDAKKTATKDHPHRDRKEIKKVQTQKQPESKTKAGPVKHNPNKS